ncbi:acyltransferase [Hymenobacter sp. 15J16-1T3B]|uniref:acyltransferase family protein n=1 Tax=Hymenobacter sp. 15J16-1T3B TaxID=2886941 RepID=UPI001D101D87|nr:acyltransferase [Hymenobacter sp. 15J16-1T3B]MCC3157502.1 acyltransferase [Hymenobacter sp. 15J16-1T3B]
MSAPVIAGSPSFATAARTYLPALTGVRALAAYLVCLHHYNPYPVGTWMDDALREFHVGVPLFFVLSGFLITLRYFGTEQWTGRWWGRYLRNRVARIYPMFFLLTTLTYAVLFLSKGPSVFYSWLFNVTFLSGFFDDYKYTGIPQGWTLTVEECFYLFAPLAFALLRRRPRLLWLLPLALLGVGAVLVNTLGRLEHHGLFGNYLFMLLFTFFGRAVEFFAGVQLALWFRRGQLRPARGLLTGAGLLLLAAVVAALVAVRGPADEFGQETPWGVVLNNVVLPGGIVLFYAGLLTEGTWLRRLLSTRLLQVLGKSSYVFYLIHIGVLQQCVKGHVSTNSWVVFGLMNLLAIALYYLVEQPLNRWLRVPYAAETVTRH